MEREVGYSKGQFDDERWKWRVSDAAAIVQVEKHELVHNGSLRFIGWEPPFYSGCDLERRLALVQNEIESDWRAFYRTLASLLGEISDRSYLYVPLAANDMRTWRERVFTDSRFIEAVIAWMKAHGHEIKSEFVPCWMRHLDELVVAGRVENPTLRKIDGWLFLLQSSSRRSANSIRLDFNENERENRKLLKQGEVRYAASYPYADAKEPGFRYHVCVDSWRETTAPQKEPTE